ncbi:zinc knuckle CX2CX4HX4C containing protein [Tanacetum coccineum]
MKQYLALTRGNQAPGVVKPKIRGNVNFEIKRVTHDAVMLRVFPITLTGAAKRWVDKLSPWTINTWDFLKKAFIERYRPPSKMAKQVMRHCTKYGKAITNELDSHGRDMKKLKENVHTIQVGCENCGGAHLNKECPLGYYTRVDNRAPFDEKKPSLEELMNKHLEEST